MREPELPKLSLRGEAVMHRFRPFFLAASPLLVPACSVSEDGVPRADAPDSGTTAVDPPSAQQQPEPRERDVPAGFEDALKDAIKEINGRTGLGPDLAVDTAKLETDVLMRLRTGGEDANEGFNLGVRAILGAYPVGHLQIYPSDSAKCGTPELPYASTSTVDACTQPFGDHAVVTKAGANNPLGLVAGDEILGIDEKSGQAMLDAAFARPMCGTGSPSASNRRATSATSIFAGMKVGSTTTIKHLDGTTETKTLAKLGLHARWCHDPLGRSVTYAAQGTIRPDGAAVLHIPSFFPRDFDKNDPVASVDKLKAAIKSEFDKVKSAPYLVIDVRANSGGATPIGQAIASGMPGARSMALFTCEARVPYTNTYGSGYDGAIEPSDEFAYAGKVAVLTDGLSFSATDYFVRTVRLATSTPIVGRPNAGAYGGSTDEIKIEKGPGLLIYPDPWRCKDPTGKPLEGETMKPNIERDLQPADLAKGIDSDVEAALGLLKSTAQP